MKKLEYLECGKIINTHGIKGTVKAESYCDSADILASLKRIYFKEKGAYVARDVLHASLQKSFVLMSLQGVDSVEDAIPLKNTVIYAAREDLDPDNDTLFIAELIGMNIVDADTGEKYGTLKNITNLGASDLYVVETVNGERMIPAVDEFVKEIDTENDLIRVSLIPGMLD